MRSASFPFQAPGAPAQPARGFTLVELLVALLILSVVATMAWQGVDAMLRSRDISAQRLEDQLRLQSTLAQWDTDLEAVQDSGAVPALQFDGGSLRLTRRTDLGLQVVVWSLRGQAWTRWAGPPSTRTATLQDSWLRAQQLMGNEPEQLRALTGVQGWQIYFWRGNAWTNAQSTGDLVAVADPAGAAASAPGTPGAPGARQALPEAVRLVLEFAPGSGRSGSLTRSLMLGPPAP